MVKYNLDQICSKNCESALKDFPDWMRMAIGGVYKRCIALGEKPKSFVEKVVNGYAGMEDEITRYQILVRVLKQKFSLKKDAKDKDLVDRIEIQNSAVYELMKYTRAKKVTDVLPKYQALEREFVEYKKINPETPGMRDKTKLKPLPKTTK